MNEWRSRLNACVRVNGGHFEHKFLASDFCCVLFVSSILVSVNVIDFKRVQSANIGVKCVNLMSENFTRYGSNIRNVWQ